MLQFQNEIDKRIKLILTKLDGKVTDWKDNELYWCLSTLIKLQDEIEKLMKEE